MTRKKTIKIIILMALLGVSITACAMPKKKENVKITKPAMEKPAEQSPPESITDFQALLIDTQWGGRDADGILKASDTFFTATTGFHDYANHSTIIDMSDFSFEKTTGKPYLTMTFSGKCRVGATVWYFPEATKTSLGTKAYFNPIIDAEGNYTEGSGLLREKIEKLS